MAVELAGLYVLLLESDGLVLLLVYHSLPKPDYPHYG